WKVSNSMFLSIFSSAVFLAVTSNAKISQSTSPILRFLGVPITLTHFTLPSFITILNSWFHGVRVFFDFLKDLKKPNTSSLWTLLQTILTSDWISSLVTSHNDSAPLLTY